MVGDKVTWRVSLQCMYWPQVAGKLTLHTTAFVRSFYRLQGKKFCYYTLNYFLLCRGDIL